MNVLQKLKKSVSARRFRVGGYSVMATAAVLAIVILVNLFVGALPATVNQIDVTSQQLYSVSKQTKKILKGLHKDVTIYWIVQTGAEDSTVGSFLERYGAYDRVTLEKIDPDIYPTFAQNYTSQVTNNSVVVTCGDRSRYVDYYEIYAVDYTDYYTTGEYSYVFDGENALTGAVDYVASDDLPTVYILSGHGETELPESFTEALDNENYLTQSLSLLTVEQVPEDADLVLIHNPQSDISQQESEVLAAYMAGGGHVMLVTNPPEGEPLSNLEKLMESYGVSSQEGIVLESDQNYYIYGNPIYLLPELNTHEITDPMIEGRYYVLLPLAHGLQVHDTLPEGVTVTPLLTTSDAAYAKAAGYEMTTMEKEDGDITGSFGLAVALEDANTGARAVWVSSAQLTDETVSATVSGGNLDFFMNSVGWMCQRQERISIRSKPLAEASLTINSSAASTMKLMMLAVIPLGYLAIGIVIFVRRKRK